MFAIHKKKNRFRRASWEFIQRSINAYLNPQTATADLQPRGGEALRVRNSDARLVEACAIFCGSAEQQDQGK
jgi:hypothetical protein